MIISIISCLVYCFSIFYVYLCICFNRLSLTNKTTCYSTTYCFINWFLNNNIERYSVHETSPGLDTCPLYPPLGVLSRGNWVTRCQGMPGHKPYQHVEHRWKIQKSVHTVSIIRYN